MLGQRMTRNACAFDFSGAAWAILLFIIFPNAFLGGVALASGVGRPYVNIDYGIPVFLIILGFRSLGVLFFLFLMSVDLLLIAGQIFPVIRLADILYLASFFLLSSSGYQVVAILVVFFIIFKCYVIFRFCGKANEWVSALVCGFMLLIYLADVRFDGDGQGRNFSRISMPYPVASQLDNFLEYRGRKFFENVYLNGEPFEKMPADSRAISRWSALNGGQGAEERLLLIVVESWGVPRQQEIQKALLRPLQDVAGSRFEQGVLPFDGVTIAGELRELCQLKPNHFNLAPVVNGFENCLPNELKEQGYRTLSMHGAVSLMYDRRDWYPRVGFDESIFYESRTWPERCYSFPGACDVDMMREVANYFSGEGKRFMYWLTLNSHSLYDERDIRVDVFDCGAFGVAADSRACRYLKLQAQFFDGLGDLLRDDDMRGVHVMLVGDHRPPMIEAQNHKAMFEYDQVPWISFVVQ